jgi:hypothetical protein
MRGGQWRELVALASVLQEGQKSHKNCAGSEFIWGIPTENNLRVEDSRVD